MTQQHFYLLQNRSKMNYKNNFAHLFAFLYPIYAPLYCSFAKKTTLLSTTIKVWFYHIFEQNGQKLSEIRVNQGLGAVNATAPRPFFFSATEKCGKILMYFWWVLALQRPSCFGGHRGLEPYTLWGFLCRLISVRCENNIRIFPPQPKCGFFAKKTKPFAPSNEKAHRKTAMCFLLLLLTCCKRLVYHNRF